MTLTPSPRLLPASKRQLDASNLNQHDLARQRAAFQHCAGLPALRARGGAAQLHHHAAPALPRE